MQYRFSGDIAQSVRMDFAPGESAWVSRGALMAYSAQMQWSLRVPGGAGEELLVSTGNLAAYAPLSSRGAMQPFRRSRCNLSAEVDCDIRSVAGCRKIVFGGEGLFMTRLRGPGRVLLQTLKRNYAAKSAS